MSTIETAARQTLRALLVNLFMPRGSFITPLLDGPHGIGKTATLYTIAEALKGFPVSVDGGTLKEGELTGIPYNNVKVDGTTEMCFTPYPSVAAIQRLEKFYYETLKEKGFLNGDLKLNNDGSLTYKHKDKTITTIPAKTTANFIFDGTLNQYEFGDDLPAEAKIRLIESGDIQPVVMLIDEMNRTNSETVKELMNIVLTKTINGYRLPWWCFMISAINPCGQDSVYATNDMDPAQRDRFLTIKVSADFNEWSDWAIKHNLNSDYIIALSTVGEEVFQQKGRGFEESEGSEQMPTPRSHTICSYIYETEEAINKTAFFTPEEVAQSSEDVRQLIIGKIGRRAASAMFAALRNKNNYINPKDILTGKDKVVDEKILDKVVHMKSSIARRILMRNIAKYIAKTLGVVYYQQNAKDAKVSADAKIQWKNIISQIKSLVAVLDPATQLIFAKDSLDTQLDFTDEHYKKYNGKVNLFALIGNSFSLDIIQQVAMTNNAIMNGDIDKK